MNGEPTVSMPPALSIKPICGNCKHGHTLPANPGNVECWKMPPSAQLIPGPQGLRLYTVRPQPDNGWTCDMHERRKAVT